MMHVRSPIEEFSLRIALIVSIGFAISTAGATYVDGRISHVRYGVRHYTFGYAIAWLAIPLLVVTIAVMRRATTRVSKCLSACLPLLCTVAASQWAFAPEVPHQGIVLTCGSYAAIVVIASWLHMSNPDTAFVEDLSLSLQTRLEGLKSAITLWQGIAIATCAGFIATLVPWPVAVFNANAHLVRSDADLFLLNSLASVQITALSIAFLIGPIREAVGTVIRLTARFRLIRDAPP